MIIGAAYLRCSDPRQDKSIEQQRDEILKRAQADGVTIPPENWFIDEGISGRSSLKRKSYLALIVRAEAQRDAMRGRGRNKVQPIDRLYVWAISRVARNMYDALRALATLDDANIDVVSLTEQDTGDKSMRKLIRPILAWLAERYSEELSKNVQRGMRSQAEKGFWLHGYPPYGYESVPVEGGGSRLMVTDQSRPAFEQVRRIFHDYLSNGDGAIRMAERYTREGIPAPSRVDRPRVYGTGWRHKHVAMILRNPIYCGHIVYDGEIACRDAHEAAVSDEDFARVQALRRLKDRNRKEGKGNGQNPIRLGERGLLTPWLRCGHCGGSIHVAAGGTRDKRTYLYYCSERADNRASCPGISVRTEVLDRIVLDALQRDVLTPDNVRNLIAATVAQLEATPDDTLIKERERLETQINALDRKIRLTAAQVVDGLIDRDDAKAMNAPLVAQRETARLKLAALPAKREVPQPDRIDPDRFREAILQAWEARPLEERREALDGLLDRVELRAGGVKILYRLKSARPFHCHQDPAGPPTPPKSPTLPSGS